VNADTEQMLRLLHPDGYRYVAAFSTDKKAKRTFSFPAADLAKVNEFVNARYTQGFNLFVGVASRKYSHDGTLKSCGSLHVLFADFDFKSGDDEADEAAVLARLAAFPIPPSIVVRTGGGLHVYWLLAAPLDLQRAEDVRLAKRLLRGLAQHLGADESAATPERILRIPGTLNHKYDPPRPVEIVRLDADQRTTVADIAAALGPLPPVREETPETPVAHSFDTKQRMDFAREYLKRQPPAVQGEGGDHHTFSVAASVVVGHELTKDETFEVMQEWNKTCRPPWSDSDLKTKIANAEQYGQGPRGDKLARHLKVRLYTEHDLLAAPAAPFLVKNMLVDSSLVALVSPPNVGKTFLALDLMLSIAAGRETWLGRRLRRHGPIVYVTGEGAGRFKFRVLAWKEAHGIATPLDWRWMKEPLNLRDRDSVKSFRALVAALQPVAVGFDTLSRCMVGSDENNQKDMGEAVAACDEIRWHSNALVLLLHHTNKDGRVERGSTVLRAAADTVFFLTEQDPDDELEPAGLPARSLIRLSCEKQKDAEAFEPMTLERRKVWLDGVLDEDGDPESSCVIRLPNAEEVAQLSARPADLESRIVAYVAKHPGLTKTALRDKVGGKTKTFGETVDRLVESGRLVREGAKLLVPASRPAVQVKVDF
jgi:hypothetical protein